MKEKVQEKINRVRKLATEPVQGAQTKASEFVSASNNLSKSIRNSKEAAIFLSELKAVITVARNKDL